MHLRNTGHRGMLLGHGLLSSSVRVVSPMKPSCGSRISSTASDHTPRLLRALRKSEGGHAGELPITNATAGMMPLSAEWGSGRKIASSQGVMSTSRLGTPSPCHSSLLLLLHTSRRHGFIGAHGERAGHVLVPRIGMMMTMLTMSSCNSCTTVHVTGGLRVAHSIAHGCCHVAGIWRLKGRGDGCAEDHR